jgi:broad specificity phosphatase PhoE
MAEILLVRHAKSYANTQDTAVGNVEAPLDHKGIKQVIGLRKDLRNRFQIDPESYEELVLSSFFRRALETAELAGFEQIDISELIAEAEVPKDMLGRGMLVAKHAKELWVPDEVKPRSREFIDKVRSGDLPYHIYFTHGMFIASVLMDLLDESQNPETFSHHFSPERGFIPGQATITTVEV